MNVTYIRAEKPVSHSCSHNGLFGDGQELGTMASERAELRVGQLMTMTEFRLFVLVLATAYSNLITVTLRNGFF